MQTGSLKNNLVLHVTPAVHLDFTPTGLVLQATLAAQYPVISHSRYSHSHIWYCMSYRAARSSIARSSTGKFAVPTEIPEKSNSVRWKKRGVWVVSSVN